MDDFTLLMQLCSPWSWLLLAGQTVLVAVLLERAVVLCFHLHVDAGALSSVLEKLAREGRIDTAKKLVAALPPTWARVLAAGLEALGSDPGCVRDACARALRDVEPMVWRRFGRLAVAALAVLVFGALGSARFLIQTPPPAEVIEVPLGLPLAWFPAAWGAAAALSAAALGGLLALRAARILRDLRELPRLLERLAYEAQGR